MLPYPGTTQNKNVNIKQNLPNQKASMLKLAYKIIVNKQNKRNMFTWLNMYNIYTSTHTCTHLLSIYTHPTHANRHIKQERKINNVMYNIYTSAQTCTHLLTFYAHPTHANIHIKQKIDEQYLHQRTYMYSFTHILLTSHSSKQIHQKNKKIKNNNNI